MIYTSAYANIPIYVDMAYQTMRLLDDAEASWDHPFGANAPTQTLAAARRSWRSIKSEEVPRQEQCFPSSTHINTSPINSLLQSINQSIQLHNVRHIQAHRARRPQGGRNSWQESRHRTWVSRYPTSQLHTENFHRICPRQGRPSWGRQARWFD